jgi:uncharacterized protein
LDKEKRKRAASAVIHVMNVAAVKILILTMVSLMACTTSGLYRGEVLLFRWNLRHGIRPFHSNNNLRTPLHAASIIPKDNARCFAQEHRVTGRRVWKGSERISWLPIWKRQHTSTTRRWMSGSSNDHSEQPSPSHQDLKPRNGMKDPNKLGNSQRLPTNRNKKISRQGSNNKNNIVITDMPSQWVRDAVRIEEETQLWVQRVVVGMNLCPFAAKPLANQQLYISVVKDSNNVVKVLQEVLAQSLAFTDETGNEPPIPGTALLVCPDLCPDDFDEYLTVLNMIVDGLLEEYDLTGKVQVVPFHPKFVFASGQDEDDSQDNDTTTISHEDDDDDDKMEYYTNRSPYPMFHILKEDDVSRAVQIMNGDTDRVWQRNVYLLNALENKCHTKSHTASSKNQPHNMQLQNYLLTGADNEAKSMRSLVKEAIDDTAKEFPLLDKPISDDS